MRIDLSIVAEHTDVGATIETTIYVGEQPVIRYRPGTRHIDTAQQSAENMIARVLAPLLREAIESDAYTRLVEAT